MKKSKGSLMLPISAFNFKIKRKINLIGLEFYLAEKKDLSLFIPFFNIIPYHRLYFENTNANKINLN